MEHWLWEPSTLQSLLVASGADMESFDDATMQTLYQQASRHKADELARQAFFSATEWEMYSSFDVTQQDETLMAMTQRLARQHIPHDVPHPTDLGALYQIGDANVQNGGESVALYRYLWAEAVSAQIFAKTKTAYQTGTLPTTELQQHVMQPTNWTEMVTAFDLETTDDLDLTDMWNRYRLDE